MCNHSERVRLQKRGTKYGCSLVKNKLSKEAR
jgi:hypothetical protein